MATKVSPSVTERRKVTCRAPYQKVLRAKPTLGHTPTHNRAHGNTRGDTMTVATPNTDAMPSRRGRASRQPPCCDGAMSHDRNPVAIEKRVATVTLIPTANRVMIRNNPQKTTELFSFGRPEEEKLRSHHHPQREATAPL
ncbi:hypothetical protein Taro_012788 [Colocasia esculenta]|uniref:Uncharacterized protein n=1 Tax=Colocasia esculenta TaxID=4460 RepID=A0A843UGS2_COLES|nr:hypothetical protein [Colocasia esculenta]